MHEEQITSKIPTGMRIIAILDMLGGGLTLLFFIINVVVQTKKLVYSPVDFLIDIFLLGYGILQVTTGKGLVLVKRWAFWTEMSCIGIDFVLNVFSLFGHNIPHIEISFRIAFIQICWDMLFVAYFVWNKNVRAAFGK